jgi:chemosensory pili system protein ChpA (sensor histidine kinase/response regulator)
VLLVLNLSELVMHMESAQHVSAKETAQGSWKASEQRRTVLIADDSVYIRQSVLQILNHAGYEVMEARDGFEALERLLTHRIDVLLLDIEMPRLNGYDLLNIIRVNPQFAKLKVVMLTSRTSEKHQRHAYAMGAQGYLTKPCPQDTLLTTVESLLHDTR